MMKLIVCIFLATLCLVLSQQIFAVSFTDHTGYIPNWAPSLDNMQILSKCISVQYGTQDFNWCSEFSGYVLDQSAGKTTVSFTDHTGYEPRWASTMGPSQALSVCNMLQYGTQDSNWCSEFSSFVLNQSYSSNNSTSASQQPQSNNPYNTNSTNTVDQANSITYQFLDRCMKANSSDDIKICANTAKKMLEYCNNISSVGIEQICSDPRLQIIANGQQANNQQATSHPTTQQNQEQSISIQDYFPPSDSNIFNNNLWNVSIPDGRDPFYDMSATQAQTRFYKSDYLEAEPVTEIEIGLFPDDQSANSALNQVLNHRVHQGFQTSGYNSNINANCYEAKAPSDIAYIDDIVCDVGNLVVYVSVSGNQYQTPPMARAFMDATLNKISPENTSTVQQPASTPYPIPQPNSANVVTITSGADQSCVSAKNCFYPSVIQVPAGATVTWQNNDRLGHTATSGHPTDTQTGTIWDSSLIKAGGTYSFTFQNAGTYDYFCMVHPWMTGIVIVGSGVQPQQSTSTNGFTPTQQDIQNINQAKTSQTIAAEVNVGANQAETKSIDSNVSVQTTINNPDSLDAKVTAPDQTGPKVIMFNLPATTINVQNLKDLGIMYDGKPISPAPNMDAILHAKSTDSPSFAIVVTQSGVQVLVLIPHFTTHTITIANMSKVIPAVPEFPFAPLILVAAIIPIIILSRIKIVRDEIS